MEEPERAYQALEKAKIGIFGTHVREPLRVLRAAGFSDPSCWLKKLQEKGWIKVVVRGERNSPKEIQLTRKDPRQRSPEPVVPSGTAVLVDFQNLYHQLREVGFKGVPIPEILAEGGENLIFSFVFVNDLTPPGVVCSLENGGFTVVLSPRRPDGHDRCDARILEVGRLLLSLPNIGRLILASGDADLAPLAEEAKRARKVLIVISADKIGPALKEFADKTIEFIPEEVATGALDYRKILEELMWMDPVIARKKLGEELEFIKAVTREAAWIIKKEKLSFFVILDMLWANPDLRLWRRKKRKLEFRKLLTALRDAGFIGYTESKTAYLNEQHPSYAALWSVVNG